MPSLAQLYRLLFFTYPEEYRLVREAEMLATLLDGAAPGQRLPSLREAAGLIAGGLRTRARIGPAGGPSAIWAQGLRLGAALAISSLAAVALLALFLPGDVQSRLLPLVLAATVVALLRWPARYGIALVALDVLAELPPRLGELLTIPSLWWFGEVCAPLAVAAAVFAWYPSACPSRRPLPWWVIGLVLILPAGLEISLFHRVYDAMEAMLGSHVPISLFAMVLPATVLGALSLLLRSPIPALGASIYLIYYLMTITSVDLALPPSVIPSYNGPLLGVTVALLAGCAVIAALCRRPARA